MHHPTHITPTALQLSHRYAHYYQRPVDTIISQHCIAYYSLIVKSSVDTSKLIGLAMDVDYLGSKLVVTGLWDYS